MSIFFEDDLVSFKDDPAIVGTIERTWSNIDSWTPSHIDCLYLHINIDHPIQARTGWSCRPAPGYVLVELMQDLDGYCLVQEKSLQLVDRSLAVGDVVKRSLSDSQSGTVISTSIACELASLCSEEAYNTKHYTPADVNIMTLRPPYDLTSSMQEMCQWAQAESHQPTLLESDLRPLPEPNSPPLLESRHPLLLANVPNTPSIQASAQQLTYCNSYREADFVIYKGWVGRVTSVHNEVTMRLTNGSVVEVENPEELEEPYFIPDSPSYNLAKRLDALRYFRVQVDTNTKPGSYPVDSPYPGQRVRTKKGNLRRGRWIFGAYDPTIPPEGIIADVRCILLKVRWLYNNKTLTQPPSLLNTDDLDSGEVIVYDRSRLSKYQPDRQLPDASHSPDIGFGVKVRFKNPAVTEMKYGRTPVNSETDRSLAVPANRSDSTISKYKQISRGATQGFDMNVLQVTSTSTRVRVRWQDCSITEETSTQLHPYVNPDEEEVWPGDRVSWKPQEELVREDGRAVLRAHKVGVVQSVDAAERMARVRWYRDKIIDINEDISWFHLSLGYGGLSKKVTELPLYDIAVHKPFIKNPGDLVAVLPDLYAAGMDPRLPAPSAINEYHTRGIGWFGEITDTCLDGDVVVRLGAAPQALEIKIPWDRTLVVASSDEDSDTDDTSESDSSDGTSDDASDEECDNDQQAAIDVSVECECGNRLANDDQDDEMWTTEDEEEADFKTSLPQIPAFPTSSADDPRDRTISCLPNTDIPAPFSILDSPPPNDHHFITTPRDMTGKLMRRVNKENKIMQSSLPDGVFVISWSDRLDLLRVLIIGPQGTPYEFAPFVFDLQYGKSFPDSPPDVFFHSWTEGTGRINPNLYEDGSICLSLLGTWEGEGSEKWIPEKSTILQVIVSIMGLILVKEPYYNEAGYEVLARSEEHKLPSQHYNEKVYLRSKTFILKAVSDTPQGLEDIIAWLYLHPEGPTLLRHVLDDSKMLMTEWDRTAGPDEAMRGTDQSPASTIKLSAGALMLLKRNLVGLEDLLKLHDRKVNFVKNEDGKAHA